MAALTTSLANSFLTAALKNGTVTGAATVYVALFVTPTTPLGGGMEVVGGNYSRTAVTFGAVAGGSVNNSAPVTFPTASAPWGTVTHVAIMDNAVGGAMLFQGPLATPKTIGNFDTMVIPANLLVATLV